MNAQLKAIKARIVATTTTTDVMIAVQAMVRFLFVLLKPKTSVSYSAEHPARRFSHPSRLHRFLPRRYPTANLRERYQVPEGVKQFVIFSRKSNRGPRCFSRRLSRFGGCCGVYRNLLDPLSNRCRVFAMPHIAFSALVSSNFICSDTFSRVAFAFLSSL